MLLCRNVNSLQRSQKTMTPRGEEGVRASLLYVQVCLMCGWVQQQHYRERKERDGGEMREREEGGEESTMVKLEI